MLTNGGPGIATESLTLHSFIAWRTQDLGGSAAVGYTLLLGLGTSLGYGKLVVPAVAGVAPVLVFAAAAGWLGLRLGVFR